MAPQTVSATDHHLKVAVTDELDWTPEVTSDHIGVAVNQGAVVLSGEVATYLEKRAAVNAALRVRGVTAVADEISVQHQFGRRDDVDVARDVARAIEADVALVDAGVKVAVEDGRVTLTGTVPWNFQRSAVERSVARIRGVNAVYNRVTLRPTRQFAAGQARKRIIDALARTVDLEPITVAVSVEGSEVTITGSVGSATDRARAEQAAWSTPGVTEVHNQLTVAR